MQNRIVFVFALCAASVFPGRAADWYRWRGPDANGISKETGWQTQLPAGGPKQLWKASVGIGFSSVSVSKGRVYTLGNADGKDTVFCFDADSGKEVWKYSYPSELDPKYYEGGPSSTPTVDGNRVYTLSKRGEAFCFDAVKGEVVWSKKLAKEVGAKMPDWGFAGSPLVEGELVIFNIGSAGTALDKKSGKVVWSSGTNEAGYATPVPYNAGTNRAILLFAKESIMALKVKDGGKLWSYPWKTTYDVNAADPIISGDKVFISSGYGHGAALLKIKDNKPELVWENKNMRNHFNSSVLWQGNLYGPDENVLACVALDTGAKRWTEKALGKGSLMMADGKIIALSDRGELIVVDPSPAGFKPISRAQVLGGKCWSVPVLANGKIYCRNAKGEVVCVDVSGAAPAAAN